MPYTVFMVYMCYIVYFFSLKPTILLFPHCPNEEIYIFGLSLCNLLRNVTQNHH